MTFNINELKIGQEVAVSTFGAWGTRYSFNWTVKSVSPKRTRVVITNATSTSEMAFNEHGNRVGVDKWCTDRLHSNAAELKVAARIDQERRALAHEISQIGLNLQLGTAPSLASMAGVMDEMANKLAAARAKLAELAKKIEAVE